MSIALAQNDRFAVLMDVPAKDKSKDAWEIWNNIVEHRGVKVISSAAYSPADKAWQVLPYGTEPMTRPDFAAVLAEFAADIEAYSEDEDEDYSDLIGDPSEDYWY